MDVTTSLANTPAASKDSLNTSITTSPAVLAGLLSEETARLIFWIHYLLCLLVSVFGTTANIINIICFAKMDLKDAINVSFLALAISDLGSVSMMFWTSLCLIPAFKEADLPFKPVDIHTLISGWPHVAFTRITSCITALITVERCLCITMPLKVKTIMTSKRVGIIIAVIVIITVCGVSPIYYTSRLTWEFSMEKNKTMLTVAYTDDRFVVEQFAHGITNIILPFGAYFAVIISTITLVTKLRQKTKWRLKSANTMSERDQKVAKMVILISSIFIICFIPLCALFLAMIMEPRLSFGGQYENTLYVLGSIGIFLEGTNSASNIFIYYRMSSKYREVFQQLFRLKAAKGGTK